VPEKWRFLPSPPFIRFEFTRLPGVGAGQPPANRPYPVAGGAGRALLASAAARGVPTPSFIQRCSFQCILVLLGDSWWMRCWELDPRPAGSYSLEPGTGSPPNTRIPGEGDARRVGSRAPAGPRSVAGSFGRTAAEHEPAVRAI